MNNTILLRKIIFACIPVGCVFYMWQTLAHIHANSTEINSMCVHWSVFLWLEFHFSVHRSLWFQWPCQFECSSLSLCRVNCAMYAVHLTYGASKYMQTEQWTSSGCGIRSYMGRCDKIRRNYNRKISTYFTCSKPLNRLYFWTMTTGRIFSDVQSVLRSYVWFWVSVFVW